MDGIWPFTPLASPLHYDGLYCFRRGKCIGCLASTKKRFLALGISERSTSGSRGLQCDGAVGEQPPDTPDACMCFCVSAHVFFFMKRKPFSLQCYTQRPLKQELPLALGFEECATQCTCWRFVQFLFLIFICRTSTKWSLLQHL
jgi:hypothetical protein